MRKTSEIRIAVGLILEGSISIEQLESIHLFASDISRTFHPRSSLFWLDESRRPGAFGQVWKAAFFEAYRQLSDFILLSEKPLSLTSGILREVTQLAEMECLDALEVLECGAPVLFLLRTDRATRAAASLDPKAWSTLSAKDFSVFLEGSGIKVIQKPLADFPAATNVVPEGYHLPSVVHFIPSPRIQSVGITPAEMNARVCSALQAVSRVKATNQLVLYGAGTVAEAVYPLIRNQVALVVDSSSSRQGTFFHHLPVEPPQVLADRAAEFDTILITPIGPENAIRSALRGILGEKYSEKTILASDGCQDSPSLETAAAPVAPAPADGGLTTVGIIPSDQVPRRPPTGTTRQLTRRGVLYVGYPCNIKCVFCYYAYTPSKEWHPVEECIHDATLYRQEYGNEWVDITGGEPTIYPGIFELLDHCRRIDLKTSIITNTIALADLDKVKRFQDYGLYDFLGSIHALTENYDMVTARRGAWRKLEQAVINFGRVGMKWRTNCTMTAHNMRQLKRIAEFAFENGSRVINFISYNPFYEWSQKMDIDFQARHSEIAPYLVETLEYCDRVGFEANVRYFPLCLMKGHEEKAYNYPQLSYDPHEWDYCSWFSDKTRNPSSKMPKFMASIAENEERLHLYLARITRSVGFDQNDTCRYCANGLLCDGFTNQYTRRFGIEEMKPYSGELVTDPTRYIRNQKKIIDE